MPWHDVSVAVGAPAACDIALHFIQRWNHHRLVKREKHQTVLMPNSTLPVSNSATPWWQHDAFPDPEDIGKLDVPATLPGLAQPFLVAQTSQHYSTRDLTREAATSPSIGATLVPAVSEEYVTALANEICPSAFRLAFRDLTGDSCTGVDRTPADLDAGAHFGRVHPIY
jgi:phosphatidylserine/phosphatidylglycerophosphate/cardiolipin synthase-like enzyme